MTTYDTITAPILSNLIGEPYTENLKDYAAYTAKMALSGALAGHLVSRISSSFSGQENPLLYGLFSGIYAAMTPAAQKTFKYLEDTLKSNGIKVSNGVKNVSIVALSSIMTALALKGMNVSNALFNSSPALIDPLLFAVPVSCLLGLTEAALKKALDDSTLSKPTAPIHLQVPGTTAERAAVAAVRAAALREAYRTRFAAPAA